MMQFFRALRCLALLAVLAASGSTNALAATCTYGAITATGGGSCTVGVSGTLMAEAIGGGGSGGSGVSGSGGGSGAYAVSTSISVTIGNTVYWSIGAAAAQTWVNYNTNSAPTSATTGVL